MRWMILAMGLLAGCAGVPGGQVTPPAKEAPPSRAKARSFVDVVRRVEPVAERQCRAALPKGRCDFRIVVDDRPGMPPNAFQTLDKSGNPIIGFTVALIADAQNADELAFVMSHEAAHHILQHLPKQQGAARVGATVLGGLISGAGGDANAVRAAARVGALLGGRSYSKSFELEADALGTRIAARAGFDPVRGAAFFNRVQDPGDRFLGTHPPNADRIKTVQRVAAGL